VIFGNVPSYGDWSLAVIYTFVFAILTFLFYRPKTGRDWRAFGAFTAFLAALFIEMYVFPLTIYLLSGWPGTRFLHVESLSHEFGQVLEMMFDWRANPPLGLFQIASTVLILGGFLLLASAWFVLHKAQQRRELARTGVYAHIRHPEYAAFVLIMSGFLLQWPTLITLAMFPILVIVYVRLAHCEEQEALARFGEPYRRYQATTPAFVPRIFPLTMNA
jgi:protein-S-isoprenylcysteine O-methyltransferase Ste14